MTLLLLLLLLLLLVLATTDRFSLPSIDRAHQGGRNPIDSVTFASASLRTISRDRTKSPSKVLGIFTDLAMRQILFTTNIYLLVGENG